MDDSRTVYAPFEASHRNGIGLCLSGGGYRAALFHLGALRRLNELGVLSRVRTISSVSGGSIAAAFVARAWYLRVAHVPPSDWDAIVREPLVALTSRNIRTGSLLWSLLPGPTAVGRLMHAYDRALRVHGKDVPLKDVAKCFVFCATDLAFGANWVLGKTRIGDYQVGYADTPPRWTLGRAVAASSCFPPIFQPMRIKPELAHTLTGGRAHNRPEWASAVQNLTLTDGGDYDNMATEPVWKDHAHVLVSDAGGLFQFGPDRGLAWRIPRYQGVQELQCRSLRKRWLVASFKQGTMSGAYWGTASATSRYGHYPGYSKALAADVIARIRTDLDRFSEDEAKVLENHGYQVADAAVQTHCASLIETPRPANPPHPRWCPPAMSEDEIRARLEDSWKRKKLGRR